MHLGYDLEGDLALISCISLEFDFILCAGLRMITTAIIMPQIEIARK